MNHKATLLVLAIVVVTILPGCSTIPSTELAATSTPFSTSSPLVSSSFTSSSNETQSLGGTSWALKSYGDINNMTPVLPGTKAITLGFSEDLNGYMGFDGYDNGYGGACKIQGNNLFIGTRTSTQLMVPDNPPGFAKQVMTYFSLLMQAKTFSITDNELVINIGQAQGLLFSRINHW